MKYETKKFSVDTYEQDIRDGWYPVFRIELESENNRLLHVTILPPYTEHCSRVVVVEFKGGHVYQHSADGVFSQSHGETCLDLFMRREAIEPKPVYHGMAYVHPSGKIVSVLPADMWGEVLAAELTPVPCTITLDAA